MEGTKERRKEGGKKEKNEGRNERRNWRKKSRKKKEEAKEQTKDERKEVIKDNKASAARLKCRSRNLPEGLRRNTKTLRGLSYTKQCHCTHWKKTVGKRERERGIQSQTRWLPKRNLDLSNCRDVLLQICIEFEV